MKKIFFSILFLLFFICSCSTEYLNDGNCEGRTPDYESNKDEPFNSLATHPTDSNILMIGSEGNGFFKSIDGGTTWTRNNLGFFYGKLFGSCAYPEIYDLIYDSSDPDKLYAATTDGPTPIDKNHAAGFYYSTDGGENWIRSVEGLHNSAIMSVAQDPSNPSVLYIGMDNAISTDNGSDNSGPNIYKSTDAGLSWTGLTLPVTNNRITYILIDPTDSNIIYAAGEDTYSSDDSDSLGFAKSADGGATWTKINTGLGGLSSPSISMDKNNSSTLYVTVYTDNGSQSYKTTDGGITWAEFPDLSVPTNASRIKVSFSDSNLIVGFNFQGIVSTSAGGTAWAEAYTLTDTSIIFNEIEFSASANIIFASSDHLKVYKSSDSGSTFSVVADIAAQIGH